MSHPYLFCPANEPCCGFGREYELDGQAGTLPSLAQYITPSASPFGSFLASSLMRVIRAACQWCIWTRAEVGDSVDVVVCLNSAI